MLRWLRVFVFIRSSYYSFWNHRKYPSASLSSREHRLNWNSITTNVTRSRKKYAIREMYCKNCRAVTDGTHFNAANPSVIDNRLSDGENQLSPRIVRMTKKRERERRRVFLHLRLVQADGTSCAPRPFWFPRGSVADKGHSYAGCS